MVGHHLKFQYLPKFTIIVKSKAHSLSFLLWDELPLWGSAQDIIALNIIVSNAYKINMIQIIYKDNKIYSHVFVKHTCH